jgi:hypothetical protein
MSSSHLLPAQFLLTHEWVLRPDDRGQVTLAGKPGLQALADPVAADDEPLPEILAELALGGQDGAVEGLGEGR